MRAFFDPPARLVSNETIYAASGAMADGDNVRPYQGRFQTIGGWVKAATDVLTGKCRNVINWSDTAGIRNIGFGTHSKLYVISGGTFADITPDTLSQGSADAAGSSGRGYGRGTYGSGTYGSPASSFLLRTWSLQTWGENLLASPRSGPLNLWENDTSAIAVQVPGAPTTIMAMLVTPERQVLALGCNEEISNDFNPLCIRWCDFENLESWDTGPGTNAGEFILEGGGQIVTGLMVGDSVGVWTDNNLHEGRFLGHPGQTYSFERVDSNCGILGPNAACTLKGIAYWVGRDRQIRAWAPGSRPVIIPCPIWAEFVANLHAAQAEKLVAVSNGKFDEVWFFYPDLRDGNENSRYVAFSIAADGPAWFRGTLARSAACDAGVLQYPLAVSPDGLSYYHEVGSLADTDPLAWRARSAAYYLDEAERVLQVQRCTPDFKDQENDILLSASVRARPNSTPIEKGPYTLATGAAKADFRFTGAIVELEFSGTGFARFGKPTFDAKVLGLR